MKKVLFILLTIAMVMPALAQNKNKPVMKFKTTTYDMGTFSADSAIKECVFEFTNTGGTDLFIHQVFTSCGCTKATHPTKPVKPGESGTITVVYDGSKKRPGKLRSSITIHNNSEEEMIKIYVSGVMVPHKVTENEAVIVD